MDTDKIYTDIKLYHSKGVSNRLIIRLLSRRYKVRKMDIDIMIYTLENTDYSWKNRRAK